jgi:hypothetical protein
LFCISWREVCDHVKKRSHSILFFLLGFSWTAGVGGVSAYTWYIVCVDHITWKTSFLLCMWRCRVIKYISLFDMCFLFCLGLELSFV